LPGDAVGEGVACLNQSLTDAGPGLKFLALGSIWFEYRERPMARILGIASELREWLGQAICQDHRGKVDVDVVSRNQSGRVSQTFVHLVGDRGNIWDIVTPVTFPGNMQRQL
jgi:hypothetical protein